MNATVCQRTILKKPKLSLTYGGYWTLWPAQLGLLSPNDLRRLQTPSPRRVTVGPPPNKQGIRAHLRLRMPATFAHGFRHQRTAFRRFRRAWEWRQSNPRRSFLTSMISSLSLTCPLRSCVSSTLSLYFFLILLLLFNVSI